MEIETERKKQMVQDRESSSPQDAEMTDDDSDKDKKDPTRSPKVRRNINENLRSRNRSVSVPRYEEESKTVTPKSKTRSKKHKVETKSPIGIIIAFSMILCVGGSCVYLNGIDFFYTLVNSQTVASPAGISQDARVKIFMNEMRDMKKKFPQQNNRSWRDIESGMIDIIKAPTKPWTFVLLSNETRIVSCLAESLGDVCSKALQSSKSLVLKPEDMGTEYGDTIDRLRDVIEEKKVVVVHDILEVHPGAIQAFHTMCDRENPLVKEAVYILTMIAPSFTTSQKPEHFIENTLTARFLNKLDRDKLQPLITRITDGPTIPVAPAKIPNECRS